METRYKGMTVVVPIAVICHSKRIQRKISKGERCMGQSLEETRRELPECFSSGVTQDTLINPPATSCDSTCEMLPTGVLIGDPEPRVFIGAGHIGTLCLGSTKFLTPGRKAGVQCAHRPRAGSHLVGKWQEPSLDRRLQMPAKGLSKDNSLTPAVLSFLHSF